MKILETDRLIISKFTLSDWEEMIALLNSPGWLKYIGERNVKDREAAEKYLQSMIDDYQKYGFSFYKMIRKSDGAFVGEAGFIKRAMLEHADVGFALMSGFEGQGYAYEATAALMNYADEHFNFEKILAITTFENLRSQKLLEKLGLKYERDIKWPKTGEVLKLYSS